MLKNIIFIAKLAHKGIEKLIDTYSNDYKIKVKLAKIYGCYLTILSEENPSLYITENFDNEQLSTIINGENNTIIKECCDIVWEVGDIESVINDFKRLNAELNDKTNLYLDNPNSVSNRLIQLIYKTIGKKMSLTKRKYYKIALNRNCTAFGLQVGDKIYSSVSEFKWDIKEKPAIINDNINDNNINDDEIDEYIGNITEFNDKTHEEKEIY